jgi:hypothetical protein
MEGARGVARDRKRESDRLKSPLALGFSGQYSSLSGIMSPERGAFLGKLMGRSKRPVEQISPNELVFCQAENDMLKGDLSKRIKINKILASATVENSKRAAVNEQYDSIISHSLKTGRGGGLGGTVDLGRKDFIDNILGPKSNSKTEFKVGQFFKKDRINKIINEVSMSQRGPNSTGEASHCQSFPDIMGRRKDNPPLTQENRSIKDGLKSKYHPQISARVGNGVDAPLFERVSNQRTGQGLAIVSNKTEAAPEKKDFFMKKTEV